jgi:HAE1 family hydrophobic/amphiphilic exporter-1
VPGGFIPEEDMGYFYVNIQLPNAASLQRTAAISNQIEEILLDYPEVEYVLNATGYSMLSGSMIPNSGFMFVSLVNWSDRDRTAKDLINEINLVLHKKLRARRVLLLVHQQFPDWAMVLDSASCCRTAQATHLATLLKIA